MSPELLKVLQELREAEALLTDAEREAADAEQVAILAHVAHQDAVARAQARLEKAAAAYWAARGCTAGSGS